MGIELKPRAISPTPTRKLFDEFILFFCLKQKKHLLLKSAQDRGQRHGSRVKSTGCTPENLFQANGPKKQASIVIFVSNKIDFKPELIKRERGEYYIHQRRNP